MAELKNVLIICIDRDNDLGKKVNIIGPVIGRKANLNAAAKLAIEDPTDSDVNSIFAAVKKFDEAKKLFSNVEIVTLIGHGKLGSESDIKINNQLDSVLEKFPADGFILVTDGAEDDQTIPILQSRAKIISKETILVKQAAEVESAYYTIKEAVKDPAIARIVFLIPGIVIILWGVLFFLNAEKFFYQAMSLVLGTYLILKGTGLEDRIASTIGSVTKSISLQRVSFPFYLLTILIFIMGIYASYNVLASPQNISIFEQSAMAAEQLINFTAIAVVSFLAGRAIDVIHLRKAFYLRRYFLSVVATLILWFIVDSGFKVILAEPYASIEWFIINVLVGFVVAVITYRISSVLDVRNKITKLLIGLPVYGADGSWVGKVENVEKSKNRISYRDIKKNEVVELGNRKFVLKEGGVFLTA